jgi:predicted transcriptional regulator
LDAWHSTPAAANPFAAEAVGTYVDRELAIIEGIQRGLADVEAGRVVPHEDAMTEIHAAIDGVHGREE